MGQLQGNSSPDGGRLDGSLQKTAVVAATHIAIGAGWGTTATKALITPSSDQRGGVTITSAGTGQSQATATVVLTFADGAFAAAPMCMATVTSTSSIDEGHVVCTATTTALTMTFSVLPVDTKVYTIKWLCIA